MGTFLKAGGVELPVPSFMEVNGELIWSSDTGRTLSGKMTGEVVAEKTTINLQWNALKDSQIKLLERHLRQGFFSVSVSGVGTLTVYRGTMQKKRWNRGDGNTWWKDVSVSLIER